MQKNRPGSVQPRRAFSACLIIVGAAALLRAGLAWYDHSVFWPDEIHQSLEQAHRAVFGYGLIPWEFRDGARSWVFPGVIAALWKVADVLGVESSLVLVMLARLSMVASSVAAIWFATKLAAASKGPRAALAVAVILATLPPSVVFSYRAMSETASASLVVIAAWLWSQRNQRASMLAGLSIGLACFLRYQNGLFAIIFAAAILMQRRWRDALVFCGAGGVVALLGGLLDWATWGRPFHSLLTYVEFNLIVGGASSFGVEPFTFYFSTLWSSTGPALILLAACFCLGALVEPVLAGAVVAFVLAHSLLPHKEFRFLVPCLPLFAAVAGIGVERVLSRLPAGRIVGPASAVALTGIFAFGLRHLTYEQMGQYLGTERASLSVWKSEEEPTLLLAEAGERQDLCGVAVLKSRAAFTGGYTYLHRDVPLLYQSELCSAAPANYVVAPVDYDPQTLPSAYTLERQRGSWGLFRREGTCSPLRDFDPMLEGARDMGLHLRRPVQASDDGSLRFDLRRDAGAFTQGWGHGETLNCDGARWAMGKRAYIDFEFEPAGPQYLFEFRARAHELATPQRFAVAVNGERLHVGQMSPQFRSYSFEIPEAALRAGPNRIELAFARTAPIRGNDVRPLAALFRSISITPQQDDFTIDVAQLDAQSHLDSGFHPPERAQDVTFIWSDGHSSEVEGIIGWPRAPYVLTVTAESIPLAPSQRTRVFANDKLVGMLQFAPRWTTERLVIPARALVKGKNRLRFEYEHVVRPAVVRKKLGDERELAVRFRHIQLTPMTASREIDFGTADARPLLLEGWSVDEVDGERTVVWSNGPRASAVLALQGIEKPVLRLSAHGYGMALPINVSVLINDVRVASFAAPDGWQDVAVPLPPRKQTATAEIVTFEFDRTAKPSDSNPKSGDTRDLALRVDRLWVEGQAGPGPLASKASPNSEKEASGVAARSLNVQ